ncbi:hypothetical protein QBC42DRAFT_172074 [Cladorrhinum samala]|uniref:CYTH domain-containing protein n=1 Tax=Cladorrhinum samala TaxID=585594 RepID=A0AAV9HUM6_9PEZI|nr:hypothetical protein QBC42DRAFT_172074 [Cladorrhinum samala]
MTPDYEVKFLLNSSLILSPGTTVPTDALLSAFSVEDSIKLYVQYVDTPAKDMYAAGWSPRIRNKEGKKGWELTYKKRYPVDDDGNNIPAEITDALLIAMQDGFDDSHPKYEAEIDWGLEKKTLSISRKHQVKEDDISKSDMTMPDVDQSRDVLRDEAPDKFNDWSSDGWGKDLLKTAILYGPVFATRYEGSWDGVDVDIEVWPIKKARGSDEMENIVEASFTVDEEADAASKQQSLRAFLQDKGWFVAQDSLKTQLVMDRYGPSS